VALIAEAGAEVTVEDAEELVEVAVAADTSVLVDTTVTAVIWAATMTAKTTAEMTAAQPEAAEALPQPVVAVEVTLMPHVKVTPREALLPVEAVEDHATTDRAERSIKQRPKCCFSTRSDMTWKREKGTTRSSRVYQAA